MLKGRCLCRSCTLFLQILVRVSTYEGRAGKRVTGTRGFRERSRGITTHATDSPKYRGCRRRIPNVAFFTQLLPLNTNHYYFCLKKNHHLAFTGWFRTAAPIIFVLFVERLFTKRGRDPDIRYALHLAWLASPRLIRIEV